MERVLQQALARWRTCRCEQLALNIDSIHEHLLRASWLPPVERELARPESTRALSAASSRDAFTTLLTTLPPPSSPRFGAHLDALRSFAPDPRVAQALRQSLEAEDDLAAPAFRPVWRRTFATLASIGDPRARSWLPPLVQSQRGGTAASRRWLLAQAAELCGALPVATRSDVAPIELPPVRPLETLSDEERLVTADWLSAHGDPRGEFLVLQQRAPFLKSLELRKMSQLVREHGRLWLGPLRRAIRPDGLKFEKGVVVACRLSGDRAAEFTGHVLWRTVRSIDLRSLQGRVSVPRMLDFFTSPVMSNLVELRAAWPGLVAALMQRRVPWRLRVLEVLGYGALEPGLLDWMPPLRELERCTVNGQRWLKREGKWTAVFA